MIIIWKADYGGQDLQRDLQRLDAINARIVEKIGGTIDGPYLPQDASVLYIFHVEKYEWLNRAGRMWFAEIEDEGLSFTPSTYEIAVTPDEFYKL